MNSADLDTKASLCTSASSLLQSSALSSHVRTGAALCLPVLAGALPFLLPWRAVGNGSRRQLEGAHTLTAWTMEDVRDGKIRRCVKLTALATSAVRLLQHRSHDTTLLTPVRLQNVPGSLTSSGSTSGCRCCCYRIAAWRRRELSEERITTIPTPIHADGRRRRQTEAGAPVR